MLGSELNQKKQSKGTPFLRHVHTAVRLLLDGNNIAVGWSQLAIKLLDSVG